MEHTALEHTAEQLTVAIVDRIPTLGSSQVKAEPARDVTVDGSRPDEVRTGRPFQRASRMARRTIAERSDRHDVEDLNVEILDSVFASLQ